MDFNITKRIRYKDMNSATVSSDPDVHHKRKIIDPYKREDETRTTLVLSPSNPLIVLPLHLSHHCKKRSTHEEHSFAWDHHSSPTKYIKYFSTDVVMYCIIKNGKTAFVLWYLRLSMNSAVFQDVTPCGFVYFATLSISSVGLQYEWCSSENFW